MRLEVELAENNPEQVLVLSLHPMVGGSALLMARRKDGKVNHPILEISADGIKLTTLEPLLGFSRIQGKIPILENEEDEYNIDMTTLFTEGVVK